VRKASRELIKTTTTKVFPPDEIFNKKNNGKSRYEEEKELTSSSSSSASSAAVIRKREPLANGPMKTLDPFLFCVYHKDLYPPGDEEMGVRDERGDGSHFHPSVPYRFYHGHRIPGFPRHPHRGFETITATIDGIIDHVDSVGNAGRYGGGDLQWMTAGSGIQHAEMFPLVNDDKANPSRFFQIWLNLPSRKKMSAPDFVMHWKDDVKKIRSKGNEYEIVAWVGQFGDDDDEASSKNSTANSANTPTPKNSWASDEANDVGVFYVEIYAENGSVAVPKAKIGKEANRYLYFVEGEEMVINGEKIRKKTGAELDASQSFTVKCTKIESTSNRNSRSDSSSNGQEGKNKCCAFLILSGRPISEPVASHGPMVMNTNAELRQAFQDFDRTQFGGWPWKSNDVVFPREKPRFMRVNGREIFAPS
jgi:redox-sensitive bicupin YhaK (pirin superfamily)